MKCYLCNTDYNVWGEMTPISFTVGDNTFKKDVCYYCLGWIPRAKLKDESTT